MINNNKENKKNRSIMGLFLMMIPVLFLVFPSIANAANLFDPASDDASLKVLSALFGGLIEGDNSQNPMLSAIKIFNSGVLIIGGILAGYTILAGTIGTAHDGEMMGKKFSSVWIPIRYSVGTALILPVVGGGYCLVQALVMWLVIQGIGLADQTWNSYMATGVQNAVTKVSPTSINASLTAAEDAFRASVCTLAYASVANGKSSQWLGWGDRYNFQRQKVENGWHYGDFGTTDKNSRTGCGTLIYPQATSGVNLTPVVVSKDSTTSSTGETGRLGNIGDIFAPIDVKPINNAHIAATDKLSDDMHQLAIESLNVGSEMTIEQAEQFYNRIVDASKAYSTSVINSMSHSEDMFAQIRNKSETQGWLLAGAWFTRIIKTNELIGNAINQTPASSQPKSNLLSPSFRRDASSALNTTNVVLNVYQNNPNDISGANAIVQNAEDERIGVNAKAMFNSLMSSFSSVLTTVDLYELKHDTRHPIIIMNEIGNRLEFLGGLIMTAAIPVSVGIGMIPLGVGAGIITGLLDIIGWFVKMPLTGLVAATVALKYFLPNLPYIIWIGCIVGWVLLVVEAIIAAPLWAIMHLHPNGDDMTGRGGNGYMLVLSLLLRPVLMIFGFIAALVISGVIGEFINKTFFEVFISSSGELTDVSGSGLGGLFSVITGSLLYCLVMYTFIRKCFGLIHQLPDQLLKWIGGGDNALGAFAGEFAQSSDRAQQIGAGAIGYGSQQIAQTGNNMGKAAHQAKLQAQKEANSKDGTTTDETEIAQKGMMGAAAHNAALGKGLAGWAGKKLGYQPPVKGADNQARSAKGLESFTAAQAQNNHEKANSVLSGSLGSDMVDERNQLTGRKDESPIGMSAERALELNQADQAIDSQLTGINRAAGEGQTGKDAAQRFMHKMNDAKANGFKSYGGSIAQAASAIGTQVQTEETQNRLARGGYSQSAMGMLSNVAGDGNGNITKGAVADRYMDNMNNIANNIAQNKYSDLPAAQAKQNAIQDVDRGISDITNTYSDSDEQSEAFKQFMLSNRPK